MTIQRQSAFFFTPQFTYTSNVLSERLFRFFLRLRFNLKVRSDQQQSK